MQHTIDILKARSSYCEDFESVRAGASIQRNGYLTQMNWSFTRTPSWSTCGSPAAYHISRIISTRQCSPSPCRIGNVRTCGVGITDAFCPQPPAKAARLVLLIRATCRYSLVATDSQPVCLPADKPCERWSPLDQSIPAIICLVFASRFLVPGPPRQNHACSSWIFSLVPCSSGFLSAYTWTWGDLALFGRTLNQCSWTCYDCLMTGAVILVAWHYAMYGPRTFHENVYYIKIVLRRPECLIPHAFVFASVIPFHATPRPWSPLVFIHHGQESST